MDRPLTTALSPSDGEREKAIAPEFMADALEKET
jgi:hypothetical protein